MELKKTLGVILCLLFGLDVLGAIYTLAINTFGLYNQVVSSLFWIVMDLAKCGTLIYAARKGSLFSHKSSSYVAYFVAFIYVIYAISQTYFIFTDKSIFAFMGIYASPITSAICLIPILLVYWDFKTWRPTKITATIAGIAYFSRSLMWIHIKTLYDLYSATLDDKYLDKVSSIGNTYAIFEYLGSVCSLVALILTIIWINERHMSPSIQQTPIDII